MCGPVYEGCWKRIAYFRIYIPKTQINVNFFTPYLQSILNCFRNVAQKYNSQFSLHLYNEIVYMCNDKILL